MVVLDTLAPAERLAFVLHDLFAVPFDEVAQVLGRSPAAARQLASRARRRVQGAAPDPEVDQARQRAVVAAGRVVRGARAVSERALGFAGRARSAGLALVDGAPGLVVAPQGRPRIVLAFTVRGGRVMGLEVIADPGRLAGLDLALVDG